MRVLSLFSGIGGLDLGLERAGMTVVRQIEKDPYCRAVLRKHWPNVRIDDDVTTAEFVEGEADVVCGGFPCQDVSNAGKRAGLSGERSGLYRELVRAIRVVRPLYAIVENVAALLGRGMGTVLGDLAEIGYDAEWSCVSACSIGAPHMRERVFIVSHRDQERRNGTGSDLHRQDDFCGGFDAWQAAKSLRQWRDVERWAKQVMEKGNGIAPPSERGGMVDGIPNRLDRVGACGNAVVPQVAEVVGRAVMGAHKAMREESVR